MKQTQVCTQITAEQHKLEEELFKGPSHISCSIMQQKLVFHPKYRFSATFRKSASLREALAHLNHVDKS